VQPFVTNGWIATAVYRRNSEEESISFRHWTGIPVIAPFSWYSPSRYGDCFSSLQ